MKPKQMKISNLSEYVALVNKIREELNIAPPKSLWFRGQANSSWDLVPSIYRSKNLNYYEREMTRDFKLSTFEFVSEKPRSDLEWMFLMQHYGLQTRLLDWSESHLTALFFAVINYGEPVDAAVWILRPAILNLAVLGEVTIATDDHPGLSDYLLGQTHRKERRIKAISPVALRPERNSARIAAQKGGFTLHGRSPKSLNAFIKASNRSGKREIPLFKITIPHAKKKQLLTELGSAGISHSVIFPEIQGICAEIRMKYSDDFAAPANLADL